MQFLQYSCINKGKMVKYVLYDTDVLKKESVG